MKRSRSWLETTSTMRPTTSVAWLYSQCVPGWNIKGCAARRVVKPSAVWSGSDTFAST
jgi:hypothetical protein